MMTAKEIEQCLHTKIPISAAMGVRVVEAGDRGLILEAPLAANHNHHGTGFGGSLNTMAILATYVMLWRELDDVSAHIVIAEGSIKFLRPVRHDLRAICPRPEPVALAAFKEKYAREGKARLAITATLEDDGETAVRFSGTFVAMR